MLSVQALMLSIVSNWKHYIIVLSTLLAFLAGWTVNGWRKDATISQIKQTQAEAIAKNASAAAEEYAIRAADIHESAMMFQKSQAEFSAKIAKISKGLKNATPLPANCVPTADRVRSLSEAIDAANSTIGQ